MRPRPRGFRRMGMLLLVVGPFEGGFGGATERRGLWGSMPPPRPARPQRPRRRRVRSLTVGSCFDGCSVTLAALAFSASSAIISCRSTSRAQTCPPKRNVGMRLCSCQCRACRSVTPKYFAVAFTPVRMTDLLVASMSYCAFVRVRNSSEDRGVLRLPVAHEKRPPVSGPESFDARFTWVFQWRFAYSRMSGREQLDSGPFVARTVHAFHCRSPPKVLASRVATST